MYAVVEYNDYRKEQHFEVITTTDDVEYAKRLSFNNAKKSIPKDGGLYMLTTDFENEYLTPKNKTITAYKVINVKKHEDVFRINYSLSTVHAVIEIEAKQKIETIDEIDMSLVCDDYDF